MPANLTSAAVKNAKPSPKGRREIPDGGAGLYLVVQPTGAKGWALRYRFEGKPIKLTLGPAIWLEGEEREAQSEPEIGRPLTLRDARVLSSSLLRQIARGHDPAAAKRDAKRIRAEGKADPDLFETVAIDFIERYAKPANRESSWRETARLLGFKPDPTAQTKLIRRDAADDAFAGVAAHWSGRRIQDIKRRDVIDLLDDIVDGGAPFSANRAFAAIRRLFNWCIERDRLAISPCAGVKPPTAEVSRDRVLSDEEVRLIWFGCDKLGAPFGPFIKFLLLTGQRRDEVAQMTWDEIDAANTCWLLPRERAKNGVAHEIPLSSQAMSILNELTRINSEPRYAFTTGHGRKKPANDELPPLVPISGFSKAKVSLDEAIAKLRRDEAVAAGIDPDDLQPLPNWRFHDLRRTLTSGMARLGVDLPVIEKVINHQSGTFAGVVGVYQRHSFSREKRQALQLWADAVEEMTKTIAPNGQSPKASNVIRLQATLR